MCSHQRRPILSLVCFIHITLKNDHRRQPIDPFLVLQKMESVLLEEEGHADKTYKGDHKVKEVAVKIRMIYLT